jgi:hypothetical protein
MSVEEFNDAKFIEAAIAFVRDYGREVRPDQGEPRADELGTGDRLV